MAINVVYAPDPSLVAQGVAEASGGIAAAEQQRFYDQFHEQQRQFDQRQQLQMEMAALENSLSNRRLNQDAFQFGVSAQQNAVARQADNQLQWQQLANNYDLQQQQLEAQQEASRQSTQRAMAGQFGAMARLKEQNKFKVGQSQMEAIDDAFQRREITPAQRDQAYKGLSDFFGFDVQTLPEVAAEQQAKAEQEQSKQMQANVDALMQGAGVPPGIPYTAFMAPDRNGQMQYDPQAAISYATKMASERRQTENNSVSAAIDQQKMQADAAAKEIQAKAKAQEDQAKYAAAMNKYDADVTSKFHELVSQEMKRREMAAKASESSATPLTPDEKRQLVLQASQMVPKPVASPGVREFGFSNGQEF